jgi:hypothetical protein
MSLTKLSLAGNNLIIPARESLVSDIPAVTGKTIIFFTVYRMNIKLYAWYAYVNEERPWGCVEGYLGTTALPEGSRIQLDHPDFRKRTVRNLLKASTARKRLLKPNP